MTTKASERTVEALRETIEINNLSTFMANSKFVVDKAGNIGAIVGKYRGGRPGTELGPLIPRYLSKPKYKQGYNEYGAEWAERLDRYGPMPEKLEMLPQEDILRFFEAGVRFGENQGVVENLHKVLRPEKNKQMEMEKLKVKSVDWAQFAKKNRSVSGGKIFKQ